MFHVQQYCRAYGMEPTKMIGRLHHSLSCVLIEGRAGTLWGWRTACFNNQRNWWRRNHMRQNQKTKCYSWLWHHPTEWPWPNHLDYLNLSCLICEMMRTAAPLFTFEIVREFNRARLYLKCSVLTSTKEDCVQRDPIIFKMIHFQRWASLWKLTTQADWI